MRIFFCLIAFLSVTSLSAEPPIGTGAAAGSEMGQDSEWQNWLFAGGSIASAVTGVLVVALVNSGGDQSH